LKVLVLVLLSVLIWSCETKIKSYIVISHTRLNDNSGVDSIVSNTDLSKYDVVMLGGDMANLTSLNDSILNYIDDVFKVSHSNTLWALGNHDYTNVELIKAKTKRETYYSYRDGSTTFIILDTQIDSSQIVGDQLLFFNTIMDTLTTKNVIILTHKLIWMRNHTLLDSQIDSVSNGHKGDCSYCVQNNNFYTDIYPKLVMFQKQSGNVFCVAGDVGFNVRKFEFITKEGVVFLASGLKANQIDNFYLKFTQSEKGNELSYHFLPLEKL